MGQQYLTPRSKLAWTWSMTARCVLSCASLLFKAHASSQKCLVLWVWRKQMGVCMTCACKVHEGEAKGYTPITSEHANVVQACHQEPATDMVIEPIKSDDDLAESIGLNFA